MTSTFTQDNAASRLRLKDLAAGLSEADLSRAGADGWSLEAWLAHLAFWDQRVLVLLRRWKADGFDPSTQFRLNRGLHRNGHLNQIEGLLGDSHG